MGILWLWQYRWWLLGGCTIAIGLTPLLSFAYIQAATHSYRYGEMDPIPPETVAIVFGAGIWNDGTPTPMLADRLDRAIALYQEGTVKKLLMTGDNGSEDYDEVTAMKRHAILMGVPEADITLDYAGFSTYESCYRARVIFGVERAILVTQQFHVARAVYTCRHLGVEALGIGTQDWGRYTRRTMIWLMFREVMAGMKALLEVHLLHPQPTFLGPFEGISSIFLAYTLGTYPRVASNRREK